MHRSLARCLAASPWRCLAAIACPSARPWLAATSPAPRQRISTRPVSALVASPGVLRTPWRSTDLHADPGMLSGWQACRLAEAATAGDATCRDGATFRQYYSQRTNRAPLCTTLACPSSPPLPASASVPALSGGASWASRWAKGPKRLPQGSWAALPCGSRCSAGGSPSTSTRPPVMRGEGGGGGATSLGHADGQANRSFMAREG